MSDERDQIEDQNVDQLIERGEEEDDFEGHQLEGGQAVDERAEAEDEPDFEGHQLETSQFEEQLEE